MHTKDISAKILCQGNQSCGFIRGLTSVKAIFNPGEHHSASQFLVRLV